MDDVDGDRQFGVLGSLELDARAVGVPVRGAKVFGVDFAVLEAAQYTGLGRQVNAGVKDKFFGSASATPRHVFPSLLRGVQDHLSAARKRNREGRANRLESEMREILAGFPSPGIFPAILKPDDQGAFVVGYYHQDADLRVPRAKGEVIDTPETDAPDTDEQD